MQGIKLVVRCKDCDKERMIEAVSRIIPIVGNFYCLSDGQESEAKRCSCGCEAFHVIGVAR